jgi:hypothetical protein
MQYETRGHQERPGTVPVSGSRGGFALWERANGRSRRVVRLDFAGYAYFCATLQEVFTARLDDTDMVKATEKSSGPGSFDALAAARNAFTMDTLLAWNMVTQCRNAWSLESREPARRPGPRGDTR